MRKLEEIYADLSDLSKIIDNNVLYRLVYEIKDIISDEDEKKAAKDWVKGSGGIRYCDGKALTVDVYRNKNFPSVILHRSYSNSGDLLRGWSVSHEISGLRLAGGYPNMRKAVKDFIDHASTVDWNRPSDVLIGDPRARAACAELGRGR